MKKVIFNIIVMAIMMIAIPISILILITSSYENTDAFGCWVLNKINLIKHLILKMNDYD